MDATLEQNTIGFGGISKARVTAGYLLSGVASLFLLFDGIMKLFKPAVVVNGTVELGYNESVILPLGIVLTAITVRVGAGAFPIIFPVIMGALVWGGLYLRDARVSNLLSPRK